MESQPSLSNNAQFVYIYYFSIRQKVAQRLKKIKRIGEGGRKRIGVVIFFLFIIYVNMGRVRGDGGAVGVCVNSLPTKL